MLGYPSNMIHSIPKYNCVKFGDLFKKYQYRQNFCQNYRQNYHQNFRKKYRQISVFTILYCNKTLHVQKSDSTPEVNGGSCDG